ncbi:MAG: copper chaperone [Deltaproteobacteria bacterium]|nr:MAG: copper chaperone [Deltaproteobacteria bacterium]
MLPVGAGVATAASGEETLEAAEAQGHVALTLQVEGMTCMGCVNGVTRLLRDQAGVHAVRVTLEPGQAELQIDPEVTSAEALIAVLAGAGYTAREE